jgi:hypothetical protein
MLWGVDSIEVDRHNIMTGAQRLGMKLIVPLQKVLRQAWCLFRWPADSVAVERLEEVDVDGLYGERSTSNDLQRVEDCDNTQFHLSTLPAADDLVLELCASNKSRMDTQRVLKGWR